MSVYEEIAGTLDYPMLIVTAAADGERGGCLVGFWSQCSIEPPRCIVFLSTSNHTCGVALRARALVAHVLRADDLETARLFGEHTDDEGIDKLSRCSWEAGPGGAPVLTGLDWFSGVVLTTTEVGDHIGFLIDVSGPEGSVAKRDQTQLGYASAKELDAGHDA